MSEGRDLIARLHRGLTLARLLAGDDVVSEAQDLQTRTEVIRAGYEKIARDLAGCERNSSCACVVCAQHERVTDNGR